MSNQESLNEALALLLNPIKEHFSKHPALVWQPIDRDFTNIPEPNENYLLLIVSRRKSGRQVVFHCHDYGAEKVWMDYNHNSPEIAFDDCNMDVVEFKMVPLEQH